MNLQEKRFKSNAEKVAFNREHRDNINSNINNYNKAVVIGKSQFEDLEMAKKKAANIRSKVINNLEKYLVTFESNFEKNGGKVVWAQDKKEAIDVILDIFEKNSVKKVVKTRSNISNEIDLVNSLVKKDIECVKTDIGEFIVQTAEEKSYHNTSPAIHKSKDDIVALFHKKYNTDKDASAEDIVAFIRKRIRKEYHSADAGISDANFLISDTGSVAISEDQGNVMMSTAFSKVHIVLATIENIIPNINDLHILWPLLSTYTTGQKNNVYNSIINGPKKDFEVDGPEKMYVVIIDNKRSDILINKDINKALTCIECGACSNVCPVYKNIGGHSYDVTYTGPIGAVKAPYLYGMEEYGHLSFACTLCGKCNDVCPVKIPLTDLLLINRRDFVSNEYNSKKDNFLNKAMRTSMLKVWPLDFLSTKKKSIVLKLLFKKSWGKRRELPVIKEKSFRTQWKEMNGLK